MDQNLNDCSSSDPRLPWSGDACSLVDAFRSGERKPVDEMRATLNAIAATDLNCFSYVDADRALEAAENADTTKPFGGVPLAIKELDPVAGWPATSASLVFADQISDHTTTSVERLRGEGGACPLGQTTASEFGGLNISVTKLNGVTHNPWRHGCTAGGSSGGSASAVAGGLVTIATGGDGGGSIRIPAGYNGLVGFKTTFGVVPRGPYAASRPLTECFGCLTRSARDVARYLDVCAGFDAYDPQSLDVDHSWEASLGLSDLSKLRVAVVPDLGTVELEPGVSDVVTEVADQLISELRMERVDVPIKVPSMAAEWMLGNLATLMDKLGDHWPKCAPLLTDAISDGLYMSDSLYNLRTAGAAEGIRIELNHLMADAFDQADLIICATNPGPAFEAESEMSSDPDPIAELFVKNRAGRKVFHGALGALRVASGVAPKIPTSIIGQAKKRVPKLLEMGGLTIPANIYGNPAVSIPGGLINGLPVGVQIMAPIHRDRMLLDVAAAAEEILAWPRMAPEARSVMANALGSM